MPEELCALGNLQNLSLSDNYFTRVGPKCRKLIGDGILDVRNNCIRDLPNQRSRIDCVSFFAKPKLICPDLISYDEINCTDAQLQSTGKRFRKPTIPKVTYSALDKHR